MTKFINFLKRNKITLIIAILFFAIYYLISSNFESNRINASIIDIKATNPYVLATKWNTIIKRNKIITLKEKDKEIIKLNDKIRTLNNSTATIFWPDWSITRLWNKTSITIKELNSSSDLSTYKINFNLENGRTWSNIVKFLTDDSYFTETYDEWNYAATARWTVFEINLDSNYINAFNHDINLQDLVKNKTLNIKEWEIVKALDIQSKTLIPNIDKTWIEDNIKNDKKYLDSLLNVWQNKIKDLAKKQTIWTKAISYIKYKTWINKDGYLINQLASSLDKQNGDIINEAKKIIPQLSKENKQKLNSKLLSIYKKVHSLPNSSEIANYKSNIRDLIIQTWDRSKKIENLKDKFIKLDIYDYLDLAKNNWEKWAVDLKNNINKYLSQMKDSNKINELLWSFSWEMLSVLKGSFNNIKDNLNKIIESDKILKNISENVKEWIIKESQNIKNSFWDVIWSIKNKIWN